jgi:ABC-type uncharacterized transport system substrate-binding protein
MLEQTSIVGSGYVTSLPRPGGNATSCKWMELLKEIAPRVTRVTLLFNPPTPTFIQVYLGPFKAAAASLGVEAICSAC